MNKFGTKNLQAFSQFFDLVLEVFFYGGSFMKPVTDVDVHEHLELADERRKPVLSNKSVHPPTNIARLESLEFKIVIERSTRSGMGGGPENVWSRIYLQRIAAADMIRER